MSTPLLKAEGLGIQFGGLKAVDEFKLVRMVQLKQLSSTY